MVNTPTINQDNSYIEVINDDIENNSENYWCK